MSVWSPRRLRQRLSLQLVVLLGILWAALATGGWAFGAVAVAVALAASAWLAPMQFTRFAIPGLLRFLPFFLARSVAGGVDVAWRACHPRLPLEITECRYRLSLPAGQARSVFVGAVSLLPGTLSRDLEGDVVSVHSIAGDPAVELARLETRVADLFGLEGPA